MTQVAEPQPALNPKLIVPFVNSVRNVFTTMVGVTTTVERPTYKTGPVVSYDVSAIIGFSGQVIGSVVVSFQMDAALKLVKAFAGVDLTSGSPDFADAIGELANMIAGNAKKDLGATASITCPSVVLGAQSRHRPFAWRAVRGHPVQNPRRRFRRRSQHEANRLTLNHKARTLS